MFELHKWEKHKKTYVSHRNFKQNSLTRYILKIVQ